MSTLDKHARAGAKGERVWTMACNNGFSALFPSSYWCQCSSATIFFSLILHSSMQYDLWSLWRTYPSGLQFSFSIQVPHLRAIINISS